jgi:hypothetical protein
MVRAILSDRKTQTRRILKLAAGHDWYPDLGGQEAGYICDPEGPGWWHVDEMACPYGALALPFLEAALAWREKARHRRVCSLFHLSFLDPMGGRARLFSRNPPDTLHLKRRPKFGLAGTNPIGSAWYCWPTAALSRFESLNLWPKEEP